MKSSSLITIAFTTVVALSFNVGPVDSTLEKVQRDIIKILLSSAKPEEKFDKIMAKADEAIREVVPPALLDKMTAENMPYLGQRIVEEFGEYIKTHDWEEIHDAIDEVLSVSEIPNAFKMFVKFSVEYMEQVDFHQLGVETNETIRAVQNKIQIPRAAKKLLFSCYEFLKTMDFEHAVETFMDGMQDELTEILADYRVVYDLARYFLGASSLTELVKNVFYNTDLLKKYSSYVDLAMNFSVQNLLQSITPSKLIEDYKKSAQSKLAPKYTEDAKKSELLEKQKKKKMMTKKTEL